MQRRSANNGKGVTLISSANERLPISSGDAVTGKKRAFPNLQVSTTATLSWVLSFSFLVCCVLGAFHYLQQWQAEQELKYEHRWQEELDPMTREWEEKMMALREENGKLQNATAKQSEDAVNRQQVEHQQKLIKSLLATKEHLRREIQRTSKRELIEKFGPGPHRVEIQLDFDPAEPIPGTEDKIIVELAPIDEMPYTVYFFLSQVEKQLFNGCSFHRNAGHVMQAGPAPNFKTPPNAGLMRRFQESMLESVSFQEYSANYPHLPYTLGYAGRPGGPDFYISVEDNSKIHGPGGQGSYEDPTEADPCFATVVEGREAVDRMVKTEVQPGGYRHMVHNVNIRYMKILK